MKSDLQPSPKGKAQKQIRERKSNLFSTTGCFYRLFSVFAARESQNGATFLSESRPVCARITRVPCALKQRKNFIGKAEQGRQESAEKKRGERGQNNGQRKHAAAGSRFFIA